MKYATTNTYQDQERRLQTKNIDHQMMNLAVRGAGLSPWESESLVGMIHEVYLPALNGKTFLPGQMNYSCVAAEEGAGKPLSKCKKINVTLTLLHSEDKGDFSSNNNKDMSIEIRRRRLSRITCEAKEQGGLLSQEDLAELLMCDVRTIRRDIKELKDLGITIPTRGQQQDIGPGVSHRAIAIKNWLEGKEPIEVARHIKHSVEAVENYLQKFKRVAYLKNKQSNEYEVALIVGISVSAAKMFSDLHDEFKDTSFFKQRMEEIELVGGQYWNAQDEKKRMTALNVSTKNEWRTP